MSPSPRHLLQETDRSQLRRLLKGYVDGEPKVASDQHKKRPQPPLEKPFDRKTPLFPLPDPLRVKPANPNITTCLRDRVSHRRFAKRPISVGQLSYLLWATQGVKSVIKDGYATKRTVPSAGARHPFETYLACLRVAGLAPGLYRYLALSHQLLPLREDAGLETPLIDACCGQKFCGRTSVVFAWAALPYRTEWRYSCHAYRAILLDAGHVGQNLYLACEALGLGTCGIGAYGQQAVDKLFGLDGEDEFVTYLAPVGYPVFSFSADRIS